MANMHPLVRFRPTDEELFAHYLVGKATGAPLPPGLIQERDIYSEEPWNIFDTTSDQTFYVFTMLRKNKSRVLRTAGNGTWKEQHTTEIRDANGQLVGYKKSFKFKEGGGSSARSGRWIMYEYSMCGDMQCKSVLCKIKYYKDEKKSKEKEIVISDDNWIQFQDDNQPAKRVCMLDNNGDQTNFIYGSAASLPSSTVDQAQPAPFPTVGNDTTYPAFDHEAYVDLLPPVAEQVNDDNGWIERLMDMDLDQVIDPDCRSCLDVFVNPSEGDTNAIPASAFGEPYNQAWDLTSFRQQGNVAESRDQDKPVPLTWADDFLLV